VTVEQLALLFGLGLLAGFINIMAGGGSTLTLPALILLGLDSATANGTNRLAIFIQNIFAISSFRKRNVHQFRESLKLAVWTLPGALIGAFFAVKISDIWFQRILGVVIIGVVISLFVPVTGSGAHTDKHSRVENRWPVYLALFGIGFYGGFVQAGVGFLIMAALYHLLKIDLIRVNMHKVFIVFIYMFPTLLIFVFTHHVHYLYGLALAAGNATGAWWSAKVQVRGGEKVVRWALAVALLLMAAKMLGVLEYIF